MRPAAGSAAAAATGRLSATATTAAASGSGCPRLTGGAVGLKDPILYYRFNDLTAIDRGTGERQGARKLRAVRAPDRLRSNGGSAGSLMCPRCTCRLRPGSTGRFRRILVMGAPPPKAGFQPKPKFKLRRNPDLPIMGEGSTGIPRLYQADECQADETGISSRHG